MHRKSLTLATTVALALGVIFLAACSGGGGANPPAQFQAHDIADFSGYSVAVADFNNDGRLDVIANSLGASEVGWYENPTWERHVIIEGVSSVVNQAMADINGDGIPEIAYQSGFAMVAANSMGFNTIAMSQGDPTMPWTTQQIDAFPTSHHVAWADLDGDGELELINALLIGEESVRPAYDQDQSSVFWYGQGDWKRGIVSDEIPGIIHRVRPVKWDPGSRDQLLVASFEGITLYRATGIGAAMTFEKELISSGHDSELDPRLGASDVGMGASGSGRIVASVEPWHGNEVVVYTEQDGGWQRRVLFSDIGSGHEIAVLDLNDDGYADIIANDQSRMTTRNPDGTPGVHVFFSPEDPATGEWIYRRIETESAMNGCVGGDMNEDGRPDLICTGAGGKIIWYENLGNEEAATDM